MTPLLLQWAARLLPPDSRDEVLRELLEQHARVRQRRGRFAAWVWRWQQPFAAAALRERSRRTAIWLGVWDDLVVSQRSLRRRPGVALTVIATIAICVSAIAAIVSVIDAVMLRPLPFPDADRLVWISSYYRSADEKPFAREDAAKAYANPMDVVDWAERERSLVALTPFETFSATVRAADRPVRVEVATVRATIGDVLRVRPLYGRLFTEADYGEGIKVLVLSHHAWQSVYGGDPAVAGRNVLLDNVPYQVIGILPDLGMRFPEATTDIWLPMPPPGPTFSNRGGVWQRVFARLDAGVSPAAAESDLERIAADLEREHSLTNKDRHVAVVPLRVGLVGETRSVLWLMGTAVALVLVIACANVGHLLLVSAHGRRRELAVRAALGARVGRLARLLLAESVWLSVAGGLLGLALGPALLRGFLRLYPETLPSVDAISISWTACAAAFAAVVAAAILAVVPSLWQARGRHLQHAMRSSERGSEDRGQRRLRAMLVVTQVALSTSLLIGGAVLLRTFWTMRATEAGFAAGPVLTFNLAVSERTYPALADEVRFYNDLLAGVRALPGVSAAGTSTLLPFAPGEFGDGFYRVGVTEDRAHVPLARLQLATPGYLEAIGLPLRAGRTITDADRAGAAPVVVVNQQLERRYFPGGAMGHQIRFRDQVFDVVGIVGDSHHRDLRDEPRAEMYYPRAQLDHPRLLAWVAVRASGDPMALVPRMRELVTSLDPGVALDDVQPLSARIERALAPDRFRAFLVGALSVVALLLAAIGLYGLVAYAVARDARDIAIRMALGASAGRTVRTVLRSVVWLSSAGVAIGTVAAIGGRQWLSEFLVGVSVSDPLTIVTVAIGLLTVSALAAAGPAARASRIDPARVLRGQ